MRARSSPACAGRWSGCVQRRLECPTGKLRRKQLSPRVRITCHTEYVPDVCTCGARLPEDARFCHKCGKPQRDEPLLREPEPAPPPLPAIQAAAPPPSIGFHNTTAVWIALRVAFLMFLLCLVSGIFSFVWLVAGGFLAVYLYRRRTGTPLSVRSGAHLGWLAGTFGFLMAMIVMTLMVLAVSEPDNIVRIREQSRAWSLSEDDLNR